MKTGLVLGLLAILGAGAPPHQETGAVVTGVIRLKREHKPRLLNASVDAMKHGVPARGDKDIFDEDVLVGPDKELANVLVRVKEIKSAAPPPVAQVEIDAAGYFFKPRIAAVRVGQTFQLKNTGLTNCNFKIRPNLNADFNQNLAKGNSSEHVFKAPEIGIKLSHDCCPWMVAWIHVLEHPFFSVTGADGKFSIKGLPAGTYTIEAWHEKFGTRTAEVTVDGKSAKSLDIAFD